jgi:hypothetical protein
MKTLIKYTTVSLQNDDKRKITIGEGLPSVCKTVGRPFLFAHVSNLKNT